MEREKKETKPSFGLVNFERRWDPQFSINLPIEYWHIDSSRNRLSRMVNVTENGLLIYLPEQIGIGKNLRLRIFFGIGHLNFIEALIEIVWKDTHLGKEGDYRTGANFVDISPANKEKLNSFLNNLMHSRASQRQMV